jgi:hypothetical protein
MGLSCKFTPFIYIYQTFDALSCYKLQKLRNNLKLENDAALFFIVSISSRTPPHIDSTSAKNMVPLGRTNLRTHVSNTYPRAIPLMAAIVYQTTNGLQYITPYVPLLFCHSDSYIYAKFYSTLSLLYL